MEDSKYFFFIFLQGKLFFFLKLHPINFGRDSHCINFQMSDLKTLWLQEYMMKTPYQLCNLNQLILQHLRCEKMLLVALISTHFKLIHSRFFLVHHLIQALQEILELIPAPAEASTPISRLDSYVPIILTVGTIFISNSPFILFIAIITKFVVELKMAVHFILVEVPFCSDSAFGFEQLYLRLQIPQETQSRQQLLVLPNFLDHRQKLVIFEQVEIYWQNLIFLQMVTLFIALGKSFFIDQALMKTYEMDHTEVEHFASTSNQAPMDQDP